jgi:16S rRNA processing protein RimM
MADNGAVKAPEDLIELGRIVSAYGIKGWVKVQPHSAQAEVLRAAPVWWLCAPTPPLVKGTQVAVGVSSTMLPHPVKQVRPQGSTVVAFLEGVDDRDQAEGMRGYTVHVSRKDFPKAQGDEFYWVDLVGCMVYSQASDTDTSLIGEVIEVVDNGAHALLRVNRLQQNPQASNEQAFTPVLDAKGRPVDVLIPFVAAHVQHVDIAARRIDTDWPIDF